MKSRPGIPFIITLAALVLLPGCAGSAVGQWKMTRAQPSREVFAIDDVSFNNNGRFEATITIDGKSNRESGTWRYSGWVLTLRPDGGGARSWPATVRPSTMEIGENGRVVYLRRVGK